jgi:cullin 1
MSLSKDLTDSFKERMEQNHNDMDINFSVMVLSPNFWSLNPPKDGFIVPTDVQLTYDRFQKYSQQKHSGRRLTWLWNYSKNELQTNYLSQKYILMTSAYQMAVLLQYNTNDMLSLDGLATATNVGKDLLRQVLQPLVKSRILINDETDQYDLNLSAHYFFDKAIFSLIKDLLDFKSKKIRVNLNQPIKAEVKAQLSNVLKTVDEDRKYVIQAAIVR